MKKPRLPRPAPFGRVLLLPLAWLLVAANVADEWREVVTHTVDADGGARARRVWFVHLDGSLYVRTTPRATWGRNALRSGRVEIEDARARGVYRVTRIEDAREIGRVHTRFREKYGVRDAGADVVRFFFGGKVVLRLEPARPGAG